MQIHIARLLQIVLLAAAVVAGQGTFALAGTTGTINGTVSLGDGTPIADARVSAVSPSASVGATTDTRGHYALLALPPDTYSVTASKQGYDTVQQLGVTVVADNVQTINLTTRKAVTTIGKVTVVGTSSALVSRSTIANVYSVNATTL